MGAPLQDGRLQAFLSGALVAHLAMVTPRGDPYLVPAWYHWDGSAVWFVGRERSEWCKMLDERPGLAVVIDAEGPYDASGEQFFTPRVTFRGVAEILERPGEGSAWVPYAREMAFRYRGEAGARYVDESANEGRWLIRLVPAETTSWEGGGWARRYRTTEA